ncbi:MFS transporter [Humibacter ginsengisoli]
MPGHPRPQTGTVSTVVAAVLGFFVITLDATIVNVALPSIRAELGGGIAGLQWVVDGYTLMFAALLLSTGSLTDRIGAGRAFGVGVALFAVASIACGAAPNLGVLIVARFVQGIGAAVVMPSSMALIRHAFDDARTRARAVAVWATGGAVAAAAGPLLGGLLSLASWRWIFLVNVPVAVLTLVLFRRGPAGPRHRVPYDWAGQIAAILAMGGITFGAIEAGTLGFLAPGVLIAFAVGILSAVAFAVIQARGRHPMVPLDLFRSRALDSAVVIGFGFMVGFYGLPFLFSLYLQTHRGLSPLATGIVFLPMLALPIALTPFMAHITDRVGPRLPVVTGLALMAAASVALALLPADAPTWALALLLVPVGLGGPLIMPPTTAVLLESAPPQQAGTVSGVFNTSRQVGGALAVAVFGALTAVSGGFYRGQQISLVVTAVVAVLAGCAAFGLRRR